MTDEKRIRDAFDDAQRRAAMTPAPQESPMGSPSRPKAPLWQQPGPLIAFGAFVLVAVIGAVVILRGDDATEVATGNGTTTEPVTEPATDPTTSAVPDTPAPTAAPGDDPAATDTDGQTTVPTTTTAPPDTVTTVPASRFRVDTAAVAADADDPFLNVRSEPDAQGELVAKLPATYRGLVATGVADAAGDGGEWIEVELVHPTPVLVAVDFDEAPTGWVNTAFVLPVAGDVSVGVDEVPACSGATSDTGGSSGGPDEAHVSYLESAEVAPGCLRIVARVAEGTAAFEWASVDDAPGVSFDGRVSMSGDLGVTFDLGAAVGSAWPRATDTADGVYVARSLDGALDLVVPAGGSVAGVSTLPGEPGVVVIDITGSGTPPPAGAGVVLTRDPILGEGYVDLVGIARPFEATLGVTVEDPSGQPVSAVFSGSTFLGTIEGTEYGVSTTDWIEAWGEFAIRAVLPPGDYTIVLDADGASDEPELLRIPVTITGEQEWGVDEALVDAAERLWLDARAGDLSATPLADEVTLLLGDEVIRSAAADALTTVADWQIDADGFAGFAGPFNAAATLASGPSALTVGPLAVCAGPPRDWPAELDGLGQVNFTPIGIDSCIAWFGVSVFFDTDGQIAAVALDFFGP